MGWRRDEIWLDTDPLWFHEPTGGDAASLELNAPAFFGLSPRALVAAIPSGLAASRQRRAEQRRRRNARRTRAAALVVGPAVMLTVAAPRLAGGSRGEAALADDPPSLATVLDVTVPDVERVARTPSQPKRPDRPIVRESTFPTIHWHRATSLGLPYSGSLSGGTQLPVEGPDWVTWNPVTDRVPNRPGRLYGNERTVRRVISVLAAYRAAHPKAPQAVVGDLSFRHGGPMEQHRSHQNGLDVDVYYPRRDGLLRAPERASQVDRRLAQDLVDRFVAAGAHKVFVGYATRLRGPRDVVVPYPNHEDHMHVRFRPPRS